MRWIIFGIGTLIAIITGGWSIWKDNYLVLAIAIIWEFVVIMMAWFKSTLDNLKADVVLQCKQNGKRFREISVTLHKIVKKITEERETKVAKARRMLNGVKQTLEKKGVEEHRGKLLGQIKESKDKFAAVSVFNISEWIDPAWFTYLSAQLALLAPKTQSEEIGEDNAKRYFVYPLDVLVDYYEEIEGFELAHESAGLKLILMKKEKMDDEFNKLIEELRSSDSESATLLQNWRGDYPDFLVTDGHYWERKPNGEFDECHSDERKKQLKAWLELFKIAEDRKFGIITSLENLKPLARLGG